MVEALLPELQHYVWEKFLATWETHLKVCVWQRMQDTQKSTKMWCITWCQKKIQFSVIFPFLSMGERMGFSGKEHWSWEALWVSDLCGITTRQWTLPGGGRRTAPVGRRPRDAGRQRRTQALVSRLHLAHAATSTTRRLSRFPGFGSGPSQQLSCGMCGRLSSGMHACL